MGHDTEERPLKYQSTKLHCLVCRQMGVDLHHVKTRASGGSDDAFNLMPLCRKHHSECHQIGLKTFVERYQGVEGWLLHNGWEYLPFTKKWVHKGF